MIQSKKIDRYNDDFYLQFSGLNHGLVNTNFSEISYLTDFSISWFDILAINTDAGGFDVNRHCVLSTGNTTGQPAFNLVISNTPGNSNLRNLIITERDTTGATNTNTPITLGNNPTINYITVTYTSSSREFNVYINSVLINTYISTIDFGSVSNKVEIGKVQQGFFFVRNGGLRDITTYDKQLSQQEVNYIYAKGVPHVSTYDNIQHYYPLNQIPYESGGNYFMSDVAGYYNPLATSSNVQLIGWTADELGLGVGGLPASTTYRGWESKTNYIPSGDYTKGLNFTRSKAQYLEITGLEVFNKDDGYTFLIGAEKTGIDPNTQQSFFSVLADEGFTTWYDVFRRGGAGNENQIQFAFPTQLNTTVSLSTVSLPNTIDVLQKNLLSFFVSDDKYVNPYNSTPINSIIDVNEQQDYTSAFYQSNNPLGKGFDELTNPKFQLGARNGLNTLNGKITFFCIIKGAITKEEEKKIYNNGLYRSPFEVLQDTSKIILDVDFTNPFVDGADIKFTDNSGNCVVIAKQNSGTDWDTLAGVEASIY